MASQQEILAAYVDAMELRVTADFVAQEPRYKFPSGKSLLQSELISHEHFAGFSQGFQNKPPQEVVMAGKTDLLGGTGYVTHHLRLNLKDVVRINEQGATLSDVEDLGLTYDAGYDRGLKS